MSISYDVKERYFAHIELYGDQHFDTVMYLYLPKKSCHDPWSNGLQVLASSCLAGLVLFFSPHNPIVLSWALIPNAKQGFNRPVLQSLLFVTKV